MDAYLAEDGRSAELVGVISDRKKLVGGSLIELLAPSRPGPMGWSGATEGPVEYVTIALQDGQVLTCVDSGLFLVCEGDRRLAVLVNGAGDRTGFGRKLQIEVMAPGREYAERFLAEVRTLMRKLNAYRGRVLSLSLNLDETLRLHFHSFPRIGRDGVILPDGLLERLERHTVGFSRHTKKLLASGRHLKRGILLHGPPGTGKTLTVMYLAGQMRERTVLVLTGRGVNFIRQSCSMSRVLQPSIVILEDVDLIAEERTRPGADCTPILFELLNEMDGLAEDTDVIFLLTTNRPDLLEPALVSRPGRIDAAIEIPLPDATCRRKLFDLYGRGLTLGVRDMDRFIARTEGLSGAFIRELFRKAALFALDETDQLHVADRHLEEALHQLVIEGGTLTKSLPGARQATVPRD